MFQSSLFDGNHQIRRNNMNALEDPSDDEEHQRPKKKIYHRHTAHQIQEMEAFFKEFPHPDEKQRRDLGRRLKLEPSQIKFWFQNKRTQIKAQYERFENSQLRNENEKLREENFRYKMALRNAACPNCVGPADMSYVYDEQHLRLENARLREEIDRISGIAAKYVGKPYPHDLAPGTSGSLDVGMGINFGHEAPMIIELAVSAMEELIRMAQTGEPLWIPNKDNNTISSETLNEDEYMRVFSRPKSISGLKSEASRESAVVITSYINLVEVLMDVNQWSTMFSSIVSRALTIEVLSTGVAAGNYNGTLQVMTAEFQVPTPLVPTRENYFVRYCKQINPDIGTWAVVDVSLDNNMQPVSPRCRRRPSGCLIQELPNGYSKVTWVEHVEVDDRAVHNHNIYKSLVDSGLAFGAKRWVNTLDRQCERLASAMANNINIPAGDVGDITSVEGRKSMMKLAERMVMSFCAGICASTAHTWTTLSGSGGDDVDVMVMTRKSMDEPGRPTGIVLSAATSFWIPVSSKRVFDFLRDENSRSEWDILSNGDLVQEMAHIVVNGRDPGNSVSLLRVSVSSQHMQNIFGGLLGHHTKSTIALKSTIVHSGNSSQSNMMLILQESTTDSTGCYVIYAPVDMVAMNVVLNGGDPDYVALLPSGFAILPDGVNSGGSLVTVAFQIMVDSVPTAQLSLGSVATVNSLIKRTVERIKASLVSDNA